MIGVQLELGALSPTKRRERAVTVYSNIETCLPGVQGVRAQKRGEKPKPPPPLDCPDGSYIKSFAICSIVQA